MLRSPVDGSTNVLRCPVDGSTNVVKSPVDGSTYQGNIIAERAMKFAMTRPTRSLQCNGALLEAVKYTVLVLKISATYVLAINVYHLYPFLSIDTMLFARSIYLS